MSSTAPVARAASGSRRPARTSRNPGPAFTTRSGAGSGPGATLISPRATVACATAEPTLTSYVTGRRRGGVPPLAGDAQGTHQRGVGDDLALAWLPHPGSTPAAQGVERGLEFLGPRRRPVDHRPVGAGPRLAYHETVLLQLLEPAGQHVGRDAG